MKITFNRAEEINAVISELATKEGFFNTKFGYACSKFVKKNLNSIFQEYNEGIESIRIENALCDEKTKELLFNEKGEYKFSKEGLKNFIAEKKSFVKQWEAKEFEVEPYIAKKELPDMNQEQKEILEGILIEKIK